MSNSPISEQQTARDSPTRNRYSERYKSLLTESPPREHNSTPERLTTGSYLKNSPLQPNKTSESKIFEGVKYISFEIKNEDRGEWRESVLKETVDETEVVQVEVTKAANPQPRPTTAVQTKTISERSPSQTPNVSTRSGLPRYMQVTSSFEQKVHSAKELHRSNNSNLLRPRTKGGISKRVGTSKIPHYQATTSINAIHDIQNEMNPDDVYIPMAARIKLFEKGLGNGSNKPSPIVPHYSSHQPTTVTNKPNHLPTPSTSSKISPTPPNDGSLPGYARKTASSENRKALNPSTSRSSSQERKKVKHEQKPFYFATSERAQHYQNEFNEKLNLWKNKDKTAHIENQKSSVKRKRQEQQQEQPNKHIKHN